MPKELASETLSRIEIAVPLDGDLANLIGTANFTPFEPSVVKFVGAFSRVLMKNPNARQFPEIISLAHWMRPKAILELADQYQKSRPAQSASASRGIVLHFAPGNVDTIFLYSALLSILAGNRNIVRISNRQSPQIDILIDVLNTLITGPDHGNMASRIAVVRYAHDDEITGQLSAICDLRVIWGGDETVKTIRAHQLAPRARDVTFPNRWSLAVINAAAFLETPPHEADKVARKFVNDSYWFSQMACSSPRLVAWQGSHSEIHDAQAKFWPTVRDQADDFAHQIPAVNFVNKLVSQDIAAIEGKLDTIPHQRDNTVSVSKLAQLSVPDDSLFVGEGFFWEAGFTNLDELAPIFDERSQTAISFGISADEWRDFIAQTGATIDRIVPFGQALQFGHIWDGMDLLTEFSRLIKIEI